eukprot:g275.t1
MGNKSSGAEKSGDVKDKLRRASHSAHENHLREAGEHPDTDSDDEGHEDHDLASSNSPLDYPPPLSEKTYAATFEETFTTKNPENALDVEYLPDYCWKGRYGVVKQIFDQAKENDGRGKLLRKVGGDGRTLLHWACESGQENMVRLLLENGAGEVMERADKEGRTPLHVAAAKGAAGAVKALIEAKKKKGEKKKNGMDFYEYLDATTKIDKRSAMHVAVLQNHKDIAAILLENNATFNLRDAHGQTVKDYGFNLKTYKHHLDRNMRSDTTTKDGKLENSETSGTALRAQKKSTRSLSSRCCPSPRVH